MGRYAVRGVRGEKGEAGMERKEGLKGVGWILRGFLGERLVVAILIESSLEAVKKVGMKVGEECFLSNESNIGKIDGS